MIIPLSKYSCSSMFWFVEGVFSNSVWLVSSLQFNNSLSSFSQSFIIVDEKVPVRIFSICFLNSGVNISFRSSDKSYALILAISVNLSIIFVIPPCFSASVIVSHPCWTNLEAYFRSIPNSDILLKDSIEPVWSIPQRIVCSPIRSDFTSATNEDSRTPALWDPSATA